MNDDAVKNVKQCMAANMFKLVISLLIMSFLTGTVASLLLVSMFTLSPIILFVLVIGVSVIQGIFQYGLFSLVLLLYTKRYAVLGHLFSGFYDRRVMLVSLGFTLIYVVMAFIGNIIFAVFGIPLDPTDFLNVYTGLLLVGALILFAVVYGLFGFSWFILHENKNLRVRDVIVQSIRLNQGKRVDFLLFCVRCIGWFLPVGILCFVITMADVFIPEVQTYTATFALVANYAYMICFYGAIIRLCIAFAARYVSCTAKYCDMGNETQAIIHLPDSSENDDAKNL